MGDLKGLHERAEKASVVLTNACRSRANILIASPYTADGALAASVTATVVLKKDGRFVVRGLDEAIPEDLERLKGEGFDLYIFCGIRGCDPEHLDKVFGDGWLLLDDRSAPRLSPSKNLLNPWEFGFTGGGEVTVSGLAYLVAACMDEALRDAAWMPVVACLSEGLDGYKRRLNGLAKVFVGDAVDSRSIKLMEGLVFYGAESRPLHLALSSTTRPFVPVLVGAGESCLATLSSAGVKLKDGAAWRTLTDLSPEDTENIVKTVRPMLAVRSTENFTKTLLGEVYVLLREEKGSPLRDAREFADLLQACTSVGKLAEAVSVCMGERSILLTEAEEVLVGQREKMKAYVQRILREEIEAVDNVVFVGEVEADDRFLRLLAGSLASVPQYCGSTVLVGGVGTGGMANLWADASLTVEPSEARVGDLLLEAGVKAEGRGGGNACHGWACVPESKVSTFVRAFRGGLKQGYAAVSAS